MQQGSGRQQAKQSQDDTDNTFLLGHLNNTYKERQSPLKSTGGITNTRTATHTKSNENFHRFFPCPAGPPPPAAHIFPPPPAGTVATLSSSLSSSCSTSPPSESQDAESERDNFDHDLLPDSIMSCSNAENDLFSMSAQLAMLLAEQEKIRKLCEKEKERIVRISSNQNSDQSSSSSSSTTRSSGSQTKYLSPSTYVGFAPKASATHASNSTIDESSNQHNSKREEKTMDGNKRGKVTPQTMRATTYSLRTEKHPNPNPTSGGYPDHNGKDHTNNTKKGLHQQQQLQSGLNCSATTQPATTSPTYVAVHPEDKHIRRSPPERSYSPSPRPPSPLRGQIYAVNTTKPLAPVSIQTSDKQETVDLGAVVGSGSAIKHNHEQHFLAAASTTAAMVLIDPTTNTYKKFNAKVENITTLVLTAAPPSSIDRVVVGAGGEEKEEKQNGRTMMRMGGHTTEGKLLADDNNCDGEEKSSIKKNRDYLELEAERTMLVGVIDGKEKREGGNHANNGKPSGYGYSDRGTAHSPDKTSFAAADLPIVEKERDNTENIRTRENKELVVVQMRDEINALKYQIDLLQKHLEEAVAVAEGQQEEIERAAAEKEELQSAHKEEVWLLKREHEVEVEGLKSRLTKVEGAAERQHDHVIELTAMIKRLQLAVDDERGESEGLRDQLHAERRSNAQLAMYVATLEKKAAETRVEVCEWKRKERAAMLEERRQYETKANGALTKALLIGNTIK